MNPAAGIALASFLDCSLITPDSERQQGLSAYQAGRDLVMAERWAEAEDPLTAATRLYPLHPESHYALGQALMGLKRYPEAVAAFTRSREAFACAALTDAARREAESRLDEEMRSIRERLRAMEQERLKLTRVSWREMNRETPLSLAESNRLLHQLEARPGRAAALEAAGQRPPARGLPGSRVRAVQCRVPRGCRTRVPRRPGTGSPLGGRPQQPGRGPDAHEPPGRGGA